MHDNYNGPYIKKFAIPFANYKIPDWGKKKKQLLDVYNEHSKERLESYQKNHKFYADNITDYSTDENCARYCHLLDPILREDLTKIFESFGYHGYNFKIGASWFQYYEKGHSHAVHNHGFGGYSCALYIEYDPAYHQPVTFVSPYLSNIDGNVVDYVPQDVNEGHLIVFPTSLSHYAPSNTTDVRRTILSMNIF